MSRKPRAIIVQPTRELAMQTIKVVRQFPLRSVACCPGDVGRALLCVPPSYRGFV